MSQPPLSPLAIEQPEPGIAVVSLQREAKLNALDATLMAELTAAAEHMRDEAGLKAVVLTGGRRMFSAGVDLDTFELASTGTDEAAARQAIEPGRRLIEAWAELPMVTIAAVEGGAVGGGFGPTLACDWRVYAQDAWASVPEVKLGLTYGWGLLPRLAALVGPSRAKWMATLCRRHPCAELQQWGLVDKAALPGEALPTALALAREVAALPGLALRQVKRAVDADTQALFSAASHRDVDDMLAGLADVEGTRVRERTLRELAGGYGQEKST